MLEKSPELPGMLLLDINLPVQTGVDCLKALKAQARFKQLPIVMYSHSAHLSTAEECLKLGATIYVKKSSSFNILKQNLAFIMSQDLTAMLNIGIKDRMLIN
jgi:DNA-binding NarL/FixJ family response regulator